VALSQTDFEFVRALVMKRSAIVLENEKLYLADTRLQGVARREGIESVEALVARMRAAPAGPLHQKVVEAMTTNETSFFRDVQPFEMLKQVVVPELMKRREAERRLRIWCAASSTGQEPYSLAMLLREQFPALRGWDVRIVASDLSTEVLEKARQGRYSQLEVNRGLPATLLVKYFQRQGTEWQIKDDLRGLIEYRQLNLIEAWPTLPPLDVILIRNVLIYFDVETKRQILGRARRLLRPDGYLFLGGAETTLNLDDSFERIEFQRAGCYQLRKGLVGGGKVA
jgi:chemotaxis protein methyltransferase CheR